MNFSLCNHTKYVELLRLFGNVFVFDISQLPTFGGFFETHEKKHKLDSGEHKFILCCAVCTRFIHIFSELVVWLAQAIQREKYFSYIFI